MRRRGSRSMSGRWRVFGAAALACAALTAAPRPAQAQLQSELARTFRDFSEYWSRGNANGIARMGASTGVSLDLDDGAMGPLGYRQVAALLHRLFDEVETVSVYTGMLESVGGNPPRAFGSLTWTSRAHGTRLPVRRTVYFSLAWDGGDGWRVTEIRLLP